MNCNIEPYSHRHEMTVLNLVKQLGVPIERDEFSRNISNYAGRSDYCLILAKTDADSVIGFAAMHYIKFIHHTNPVCRLMTLVVDNEVRNKGVGKLILPEVETLAIRYGCRQLELTSNVSRERTGTFAFYESCGHINQKDKKHYLLKHL